MDSKRTTRRELLKGGAALTGGLTLGAVAPALGQTPATDAMPDHSMAPAPASGTPMIMTTEEQVGYGARSHFVTSLRISHPIGGRPSPDAFGLFHHIAAPLQDSVGVVTPSSLHYVSVTRGAYVPDIDPKKHTLLVHGEVDRPLIFTMDDLKRLPSVTRMHFIECNANRADKHGKSVQETHGLTSCAEWTGVLLSTLFKECGIKRSAKWFIAEGAEEVMGASSMPIAKAMDDVIVAYGMNGEPVRPQNGFPLRLIVPGFEGMYHTKFLRRIKAVDRYYMNYDDYGHLEETPQMAALNMQIGPKSVITHPSAGHRLPGPGSYEISGLAWSGGGAIRTVEVSTDGGRNWHPAELKSTPQRMAHVRFGYQWNWDGNETMILSRCVDEIGQIQPTKEQVAQYWNVPLTKDYEVPGLDNSVMPWKIANDGSVTNGLAKPLAIALLFLAGPALAQSKGPYGVGRTPTPAEIHALDISIDPAGTELPVGHGTAKEGEALFTEKGCIGCHGAAGVGGKGFWLAPALKSTKPQGTPVWKSERILPLRAPYATVVWDFIHRGMPLGHEGSLTPNEIYSLTAYLLYLNHVVAENQVLDKQTLPKVKMPIGDDYAPMPDWKSHSPRLAGYPY